MLDPKGLHEAVVAGEYVLRGNADHKLEAFTAAIRAYLASASVPQGVVDCPKCEGTGFKDAGGARLTLARTPCPSCAGSGIKASRASPQIPAGGAEAEWCERLRHVHETLPKPSITGDDIIADRDEQAALSKQEPVDGWREQPWMGPDTLASKRWDNHDEAIATILSAGTVAVLSYEEAALIYARARGFIVDDAELMAAAPQADPVDGWRDMSSAPRDGSRFLARQGDRHFDCWWHDTGYGEAYWQDEADSEPDPSLWLPLNFLPAAPKPETSPATGPETAQ